MSAEMAKLTDSEIIHSWHINAEPWIKAIDNHEIESRKLVTNKAIVDIIMQIPAGTVLDVGCGEGWLAKELVNKGLQLFGIDAVPELIEKAKQNANGTFAVCTYEDLADYPLGRTFDCVVCNFSLIGKESTQAVIQAIRKLLAPQGRLVIQTLHPVIACGDMPYEDGWREGSWTGFSSDFTSPAPWYFRTISTWCSLFTGNGFQITGIYEPLHPKTGKAASMIFDLGLNHAT